MAIRKFLLILILILFAGIGIIGFWYWQRNIYSKEVLKLEILAPEKVGAGEEFEYLVKLKHNGKVRLENPELVFEAPEKAILKDYERLRIREKIEDIYPGEERSYSFRARIFGREGETFTAKAWASYQPKNLKASFESKTSFTNEIKSVALTFEFNLPPRVESGEEINFSLNYFSNIDYLLENLKVKIEYPLGFNYISSEPVPLEKNEWIIPSLYRASGGKIGVKGEIEGEEGQEKVFKAQLGIMKDGDFWLLREIKESVKILEPSLYISHLINSSQEYTAFAGELLHYEFFFRNIGRTPVQKKFVFAKLEGDFFDINTLKSNEGEVGRGDRTVLWDWKKVSALRFLDVGEEGKIEFWVHLKDKINYQLKNPKVIVEIDLGGLKKVFETKINSQLGLSQKVYFEQEFFENSGKLPPRVGEITEYVVLWEIKNTWNKLTNIKVKSVLGENVRPTGKIFPENGRFTYDSESKEVLWSLEEIEPFPDLEENASSTLAFQIELRPDDSQRDKTPILIKEAEILAEDNWTSEILREKAEAVDTTLPDDKTLTEEQGLVQ